MLDADIKRRIDNARKVLVGKIPDPKGQVEFITVALIYKFLADNDKRAQDGGGARTFFIGEYAPLYWSELLDAQKSGKERLELFERALKAIAEHPDVPESFRAIFGGAALPFRDARTLDLFLAEINEIPYSRAEDMGTPYEYLLSIMDSNSGAGQFRTPQHIIDFIVGVADPQKGDRVCDPACGTAGFLIAAHAHIMNANKKQTPGDMLTPDDKDELAAKWRGCDIDPGMARLAMANAYMHGIRREGMVQVYDSLTSAEHWGEKYDVILANPPFMTPKGGIQPHRLFAVQANRSEVLFVDYIGEHIAPGGRAGVIVPEGIIFQTGRAYKQLRKHLVEDWGLYAVVSLPAGVFNPYSGVKTSVLLFDKTLAKHPKILFVNVANDGFDLGAQRRPINKNDLPQAADILRQWRAKQTIAKGATIAYAVERKRIAEDGVYDLTSDRYREAANNTSAKWQMARLGDVATIGAGNSAPQNEALFKKGKYPFCRTSDVGKAHLSDNFSEIADRLNDEGVKGMKLHKENTILFPKSGASTFLNHRVMLAVDSYVSSHLATIYADESKVVARYLFYTLSYIDAKTLTNAQSYPSLRLSVIANIQIPLPPLEVQREIVAEIGGWQKIINGAQQVADNWRPHITIAPDWKPARLGDICEVKKGQSITKKQITPGEVPVVAGGRSAAYYHNKANRPGNTVTVSGSGAYAGFVNYFDKPIFASDCSTVRSLDEKKVLTKFVYYMLSGMQQTLYDKRRGMAQPHVYPRDVQSVNIQLPPLKVQQKIVAEIDAEREAINNCRALIESHKRKIADKIGELWDAKK